VQRGQSIELFKFSTCAAGVGDGRPTWRAGQGAIGAAEAGSASAKAEKARRIIASLSAAPSRLELAEREGWNAWKA
jgi:hypothetical protein